MLALSLEDRRRDARLTMLYKIDHELVAISKTDRLDRSGLAYSTSGRTRVFYACSLIDIDEIFRFLRRKPRVLFALFVMESMCWLQPDRHQKAGVCTTKGSKVRLK
jgi:hypothetical protein